MRVQNQKGHGLFYSELVKKMEKKFLFCFFLLLSYAAVDTAAAKKTKKLKITTEVCNHYYNYVSTVFTLILYYSLQSKPSDCSVVAEPGDTLVVHYTVSVYILRMYCSVLDCLYDRKSVFYDAYREVLRMDKCLTAPLSVIPSPSH